MQIKVLGSTKLGYEMTTEEILEFAGKEANICYTTKTIDDIFAEPAEKSIKRAKGTLNSGHHSIADHVRYNFGISGIPKILAMILNNEGMYSTSEKSARYTKMILSPREQEKYNKWLNVFCNLIEKEYGARFLVYNEKTSPDKDASELTRKQITKLAQENARYMISVFTPTIMGYSVDVRQLNYIYDWLKKFLLDADDSHFKKMLRVHVADFLEVMEPYTSINEIKDMKGRNISLFDSRSSRQEYFGEVYSVNYKGSFAELAQAQRHRTLRYKMSFLPQNEFYIPKLIEGNEELRNEWLSDISSLADIFPQGMLIMINERGTYEDFIQKCSERLCGQAQLEIALQTHETAKKYVDAVKESNPEIYNILLPYSTKARCQNGWHCGKVCVWGGNGAFARKV